MDTDKLKKWIRGAGEEIFTQSGGPGGQNVNKVSTKVVLKLPVEEIPDMTEDTLKRLKYRLSNKINNKGELVIQSSEERSQLKNRRIAEERAVNLILEAIRPEKKRKPSKPRKAVKEKRLRRKKKRSRLKEARREPEQE